MIANTTIEIHGSDLDVVILAMAIGAILMLALVLVTTPRKGWR